MYLFMYVFMYVYIYIYVSVCFLCIYSHTNYVCVSPVFCIKHRVLPQYFANL